MNAQLLIKACVYRAQNILPRPDFYTNREFFLPQNGMTGEGIFFLEGIFCRQVD